jgi:hypothetical protein
LDEFQVQLIGQACLLCKNSNIHHHWKYQQPGAKN